MNTQIVRYFAMDFTASDVAQLTRLTRKTVTVIFLRIRQRVAAECERASPYRDCEVEVDESYFGARRVRGKRGRGASGKTIVFGIFKRHGCVYTEVVPDCRKARRANRLRTISISISSVGYGVGRGVKLDPIGADGLHLRYLRAISIHNQADSDFQTF